MCVRGGGGGGGALSERTTEVSMHRCICISFPSHKGIEFDFRIFLNTPPTHTHPHTHTPTTHPFHAVLC